ncbi:SHOCT domain-containing protein [Flavobacterium sp.]|uniref:SHOCT domain-containing protein n=1 Tax=Flavobacterium sp. TaxID=239 RepID=UPI00286AEF57|nr:SHOCT domain-containing protein [Flavobacterium sp.]
MKKTILILFLTVSTVSFAQLVGKKTNAKELEKAVELLSQNIQANPDNPLNINNEFLFNLSNLIDDASTKNILQSYSTNLGVDKDLSYRQVYWDLAKVLDQNPSIASNLQYKNTSQGLDVMFDNYNLLASKLKNDGGKYELGSFVNDPSVINSLQNITGSYESAQALGLGVDLFASLTQAFAEGQKFKEDYKKLALLSSKNLYIETDANLNSALLDVYLGIEGHQIITPIYRYDFNNGASLRVENGILKYFNSAKGIVKNLILVDKRHDGKFYKYKDMRGAFYSTILISKDESVFYIYANQKAITDNKCDTCLEKAGYVLRSIDGSTLFTKSGSLVPSGGNPGFDIFNAYFDKDNAVVYNMISASGIGGYGIRNLLFKDKVKSFELVSGLDKNKNFVINGNPRKFRDDNSFQESLFDKHIQYVYLYQKEECSINLFWANGDKELDPNKTTYASSMLQIAKKQDYYNPDGMINELTGLAMKINGDLYFAGTNGGIGKLKANDYKLDDPSLTSKIRSALTNKIFAPYDFIADKEYTSLHGQIITHADAFPLYPSLKFTPDEKLLIYTLKDNLYVVNPDDFNDAKHYKLSCQPYNTYFTKESGDWVLNIQALNEFKFPITKKYSIDKLSKMEIKKISPTKSNAKKTNVTDTNENTTKIAATSANDSNFSLADEIKKLKELLDAGAITQDEYTAAKAKLLNTPAKNGTKATPTNTTSPTKKPSKNVIEFKIKGKSYCAVKAPENGLDIIYGLYKYLGKEIRTYESKEGEPIVQLNKADIDSGKSGLWQAHGERSKAITWWLLSDCNGNLDVTKTEDFDRYNIVVRYEEEDEPGHSNYPKGGFDFMSLSIYTDGSNKVLILGERVKQK